MGHYHKIAQACRMVALGMAHEAGKGHVGTSLSSMDIIAAIRSLVREGDLFLSSKGHDALAQYSILAAWGILTPEQLKTYRKPGGLPGHPTVEVPGIVCNTGSLGMGLSKACGFVHAARLRAAVQDPADVMASGRTAREEVSATAATGERLTPASRRVFVLLGDGEMSEGQNYEAMLYAARHDMGEITAVVDCNGWQQDGPAAMDAARIALMFRAAGWTCEIVQGDADKLRRMFGMRGEGPTCWVVETAKGQGVSFIQADPVAWHNRAPTDEEFHKALEELEHGRGQEDPIPRYVRSGATGGRGPID